MDISYDLLLQLSLAAIGIFGLGLLIMYVIQKSLRVSRNSYDQVKEENILFKNKVESSSKIEEDLADTIKDSKIELEKFRVNNENLNSSNVVLETTIKNLKEKLIEERNIKNNINEAFELLSRELLELKTNISNAQLTIKNQEAKLSEQNVDFENLRKKSLMEFENIANRLFEEKSSKFSKHSKDSIEQLLQPLKENLKDFKKQVEETYHKESKERFSLENKIRDLVQLNQQISKDATNLTNALKGQSKTQGDWGEMILESILEYSGLVKDRQYTVQTSYVDGFGNRKQPDVTIKYPDNRYIIVDSKVSLTAYERYANAETRDEQQIHLNNHLKSIKNHIDSLSSKEYDQFDKSLDFVFLFIPIEPAFLTALQHDNNLWSYAYAKRIVLMSPTNLIATLRVIVDVWNKEDQNNNAREISKRGEMLYSKFVGFVTDMEELDKYLNRANQKFDSAMGKLTSGKGNLIYQAEKLKSLGVVSSKSISQKLIDKSLSDDESE